MTQAEILRGLMQDESGYKKPRLFVGGPLDGRYITVPYHGRPEPYYCVAPSPSAPDVQTARGAIVTRQHRYNPQVWRTHKTSVVLMVHESVPSEEVMPRIIAGYCPAPRDKQ